MTTEKTFEKVKGGGPPLPPRIQAMAALSRVIFTVSLLFLLLFFLANLIAGGPKKVISSLQDLLTPKLPKLTLTANGQDFQVSPLPQALASQLVLELDELTSNDLAQQGLLGRQENPLSAVLNQSNYQSKEITVQAATLEKLTFARSPGQIRLYYLFNGKEYLATQLEDLKAFQPPVDGPCHVLVEARWPAARSWQTSRQGLYSFVLRFDRPTQFRLSRDTFNPGELLVVYARNLLPTEAVSVKGDLPVSVSFSPFSGTESVALVPLGLDLPPGQHRLALGTHLTQQDFQLTLKDLEFPEIQDPSPLLIPNWSRHEPTRALYQNQIEPLLATADPQLRWTDPATAPLDQGDLYIPFGSRAPSNGQNAGSRYLGSVFQALAGSSVKSINEGMVVFSEAIGDLGQLVILEHGLGMKTWYFPLTRLQIQEGDKVKKGETLGLLSGQAGSLSPLQLHLSVKSTFVDPAPLLQGPLFSQELP